MTEAKRRRYLAVPPPPPLRPFVECLWAHAVPGPAPGDDHRILPDGRIDLVRIRELGLVVAGPQSRHTRRPVAAPMVAFGARFHPGVAPALLRLPASELVDEHVPLAAIDSALAARLETRLGYGPKTFQRIMRFQRVAGELRRGGVELARAAAAAGYADQAHLTRESRRLAGLSPRQLVSWMG